MSQEDVERLRRRSTRDRVARREAEKLLEEESGALFDLNLELRKLAESLEARVQERTAELEIAREEALESSRAKSRFLANMSHEMRTPLNGVIGFVDLLQDTQLDKLQSDYIDIVQSSGELLLSLIGDILDFSKIEAGALNLDLVVFEPAKMIQRVTALLQANARELQIDLSIDLGAEDFPSMIGDPDRLAQVLLNLLSNAVKFTKEGSVTLRARSQRKGGMYALTIEVIDTGIGIPEDRQEAIFGAFEQADDSTARKFGGTGLGLAIAAELVRLMGGNLRVESEEGVGSHFYFMIELRPGSDFEAVGEYVPHDATQALAPLDVLLVEDDGVNMRLCRSLLERDGHSVWIAPDDQRALALLGEHDFDVVLMNLHLNSLEAVRRIRATDRRTAGRVPVIAFTAAIEEERDELLEAGVDACLREPIRPDELRRALRALAGPAGVDDAA